MTEDIHDWEYVTGSSQDLDSTRRMKVPGGWIYQTVIGTANGVWLSTAFVPAPSEKSWNELTAKLEEVALEVRRGNRKVRNLGVRRSATFQPPSATGEHE